ncbi:hypothetical protein [Asticcacaulis solisilvae]|uniref:hypothetical protein n=1 Tax=Asticcacaulis solisilvae TaxID=1217274 RepID=UPI003FD7A72E
MNKGIRTFHRWAGFVLSVAVIINIVALVMKVQSFAIGLLALIPLLAMMGTGLYMFAEPYIIKGKRTEAAE